MLGFSRRLQRGDTLIEVLFAVTVFSFVIVGALAVMNQGTAAAQRSLDVTVVRQEIDAQAEALRFFHDSYVAVYQPGISFVTNDAPTSPAEEWYKLANAIGGSPISSLSGVTDCPASHPPGSFVIDTRNVRYMPGTGANLQQATTFAQLEYQPGTTPQPFITSRGIWIEAIRSQASGDANQQNVRYIDFHIRACWKGAGLDVPMTLGTIVRLYEPRG